MDNLFDFDLPERLIAQSPASPRDHARLLVYNRSTQKIVDDYFYNLDKYLEPTTTMVANNTKVDHCRYLFDGAKTEIFVVEAVNDNTVRAMIRPGRKFKLGAKIQLIDDVLAQVMAIDEDGIRTIRFSCSRDDPRLIEASHVPLPPYIAQNDELADEYQTIYAKRSGSLAAPTAGLHFTEELKSRIAKDHPWLEVTLNVGLGTFASLQQSNFESSTLHTESYSIESEVAEKIMAASHITAIGTTSLRTVETYAYNNTENGETNIFITPGYEFRRVDSLITNFHLPRTSLLLLVEAFIGSRKGLERVYGHAIASDYRFYSFGDGMLIL